MNVGHDGPAIPLKYLNMPVSRHQVRPLTSIKAFVANSTDVRRIRGWSSPIGSAMPTPPPRLWSNRVRSRLRWRCTTASSLAYILLASHPWWSVPIQRRQTKRNDNAWIEKIIARNTRKVELSSKIKESHHEKVKSIWYSKHGKDDQLRQLKIDQV